MERNAGGRSSDSGAKPGSIHDGYVACAPVEWSDAESEASAGAGTEQRDESHSTRECIADILERPQSSPFAAAAHYIIVGAIVGSAAISVVETVPELRHHNELFFALDNLITLFFTIELTLRFWSCQSFAVFVWNVYNIIDVIAVVPGYIEVYVVAVGKSQNLKLASFREDVASVQRNVRILRLIRIVRVMRLVREWQYAHELALLFKVMNEVSDAGINLVMAFLGLATVIAASIAYFFESPHCLDLALVQVPSAETLGEGNHFAYSLDHECTGRSHFDSIPSGFWWALMTLTTTGYGDMVPSTGMGKVLGGFTCIAAVMVISAAAAMMSVHFRDRWLQEKAKAGFQRRFAAFPAMAREQNDIEDMLVDLQASADLLSAKLADFTVRVDERTRSQSMVPMLKSVNSHALALVNGTCCYVYELLFEEMLRSQSLDSSVPLRAAGEE